jgi:hypothetical protein
MCSHSRREKGFDPEEHDEGLSGFSCSAKELRILGRLRMTRTFVGPGTYGMLGKATHYQRDLSKELTAGTEPETVPKGRRGRHALLNG